MSGNKKNTSFGRNFGNQLCGELRLDFRCKEYFQHNEMISVGCHIQWMTFYGGTHKRMEFSETLDHLKSSTNSHASNSHLQLNTLPRRQVDLLGNRCFQGFIGLPGMR